METFCLLLTGRLAPGRDGAEAHAALAAAFGMDTAGFLAKVWQRAPLIVRWALDADAAAAQAAQWQALGADARVLPDRGPMAWLLRDQQVLGPLPGPALAAFARRGDRWCLDGAADWRSWIETGTPVPPPLPAARALPPPLTASPPAPVQRRRRPWIVTGVAAALLLGALIGLPWLHRASSGTVDGAQPQPYVPRPLQPLPAATTPPAPASCAAGPAPTSDEERFLLAGGGRHLTGLSQRKGDTYVTEAILGYDDHCRPAALQLYVFRSGVYLGTAFDAPLDPGRTKLSDVQLSDDRQLRFSLARCRAADDCGPATGFKLQLQPGDGGWTLDYAGSGNRPVATLQIVDHPPPRYPAEAIRQRHEGTVLLVFTVGADGRPDRVSVDRSSGYPELDQAALEAVRRWRFKVDPRDGAGPQAPARVPVRFRLDH